MDPLKQEFIDLLRTVGWTQAETARQLCMTSGAVNQIVNPHSPVRPSLTTLRLFKMVVAAQRPEAVDPHTLELQKPPPGLSNLERDLFLELRRVPQGARPQAVAVLHGVIAAFQSKGGAGKVLRKNRSTR